MVGKTLVGKLSNSVPSPCVLIYMNGAEPKV